MEDGISIKYERFIYHRTGNIIRCHLFLYQIFINESYDKSLIIK